MISTVTSLTKVCSACSEAKPYAEYYLCGVRRTAKCKSCELARQRAHKQTILPERWMFDRVRHRAKAEGREFRISICDIFIPEFCPILGVKLGPVGGPKQTAYTPTLDRIDNSIGYVPGNVFVISAKANKLKGEGSAEQHQRIASWMRSYGVK